VPGNTLKTVLPQLREEGRVRRGFLGITVADVSPEAAEAFGLDGTDGALVSAVTPGTPAEKADLQVGDIVLRVDGLAVSNTRSLIDYVSAQGPDVEVELDVLRDGETIRRDVTLAERPADGESKPVTEEEQEGGIEWLGIRYQDLVPGLRAMHRIPDGVTGAWITDISPRSPLYEAGVRPDVMSIIAEVNGQAIESVADLERVVGEARSGSRLRMYIRRFADGAEVNPLFAFPAKP
jgi:serine protease Do